MNNTYIFSDEDSKDLFGLISLLNNMNISSNKTKKSKCVKSNINKICNKIMLYNYSLDNYIKNIFNLLNNCKLVS
jgi:hypothetical protein